MSDSTPNQTARPKGREVSGSTAQVALCKTTQFRLEGFAYRQRRKRVATQTVPLTAVLPTTLVPLTAVLPTALVPLTAPLATVLVPLTAPRATVPVPLTAPLATVAVPFATVLTG